MALIKMRLDGADMMVPEESCVWTKKNGKLHHIHTLGEGFSLFEFEGLEGTFEERFQQVKDNRAAVLDSSVTNDESESEKKDFPKMKKIIFPREDAYDFPESTWRQKVKAAKKPKKQTTKDWLFDN